MSERALKDNELAKLTIKGFKSIKELVDFELKPLNVLIGANGSGKSNLISFFKMYRSLMDDELQTYIINNGRMDNVLFNGRKMTEFMEFETHFGPRGHRFKLFSHPDNTAYIKDEARFYDQSRGEPDWWELGDNHDAKSQVVAEVKENRSDARLSKRVYNAILSWKVYHFHDTSPTAGMRFPQEALQGGRERLRADGSNIAPFLLYIRSNFPKQYRRIVQSIKAIAPFFKDFSLDAVEEGPRRMVNLHWHQNGTDNPMQPYHLSDGTIRFICLAAVLLQPEPPATIVIDEPELGLHPAALVILAELIEEASAKMQIIMGTHSPRLLDYFSITDIIAVNRNRENGASMFERLEMEKYKEWLDEDTIGDLWLKNDISARPVYEKSIAAQKEKSLQNN
ncbi:hypothetical protein COTS27_00311 [Spirochaetota bacterium]|nr:hypothetical protein COTS27_00311 [Spirochaetota bacterium]